MTWSVTPSRLVGGQPIVQWKDTPLRQLTDAEFRKAVESASALGDDTITSVVNETPANSMVGEADAVVLAVMREMTRRDMPDTAVRETQETDGEAA